MNNKNLMGSPNFVPGQDNAQLRKALFLERMDELSACPAYRLTCYVSDEGFHVFAEEGFPSSDWSSSNLSGEAVIGLFATSFVTACRDGRYTSQDDVNSPV